MYSFFSNNVLWIILGVLTAAFAARFLVGIVQSLMERPEGTDWEWVRPRTGAGADKETARPRSSVATPTEGMTLIEAAGLERPAKRALEEAQEGQEVESEETGTQRPGRAAPSRGTRRTTGRRVPALRRALRRKDALRQMVLAQDILGPPRGLREREF